MRSFVKVLSVPFVFLLKNYYSLSNFSNEREHKITQQSFLVTQLSGPRFYLERLHNYSQKTKYRIPQPTKYPTLANFIKSYSILNTQNTTVFATIAQIKQHQSCKHQTQAHKSCSGQARIKKSFTHANRPGQTRAVNTAKPDLPTARRVCGITSVTSSRLNLLQKLAPKGNITSSLETLGRKS